MADYSQQAKNFDARLKQGVPKDAVQRGLAAFKAQQASKAKGTSNANANTTGQRVRSRGGITRG
mgnify:CR=1 FL=1